MKYQPNTGIVLTVLFSREYTAENTEHRTLNTDNQTAESRYSKMFISKGSNCRLKNVSGVPQISHQSEVKYAIRIIVGNKENLYKFVRFLTPERQKKRTKFALEKKMSMLSDFYHQERKRPIVRIKL